MSNIIQSVSITKHINPSKQISDEYTLMITYRDVVYITKIKEDNFRSNLFEFDMLEQLIYNSNHKQKVGDVFCDMEIKESEAFGKVLDVKLLFERDVKPMKKINEEHPFQLQEKKLDYDDKIGLAMSNLRSEINFVTIKPTTKIVNIINNNITISWDCTIFRIWCDHPEKKTNISVYLRNYTTDTGFIETTNQNYYQFIQNNYNSCYIKDDNKLITNDEQFIEFNKFSNWNTDFSVYWSLLEHIKNKYFTYTINQNGVVKLKTLEEIKIIQPNELPLEYYLKNNYVDMIKINNVNNLIIFIDETKKPNNRKITLYENVDKFEKVREQFKSYHILDMNLFGILIEEIT